MNCKQGDLAIIVRSAAGNEGKIVRCVRYMGVMTWRTLDHMSTYMAPTWEVDRQIPDVTGATENVLEDSQLRPIRPATGEDETLRWAEKPLEIV